MSADVAAAGSKSDLPARKGPRWGAADGIIAAALALVLIIVGVFALLSYQGYGATLDMARQKAITAASVVAEQTRWVFGSARGSLDHVANEIGEDPANASAAVLADFTAATDAIPMQMRLGVYDTTGSLVAESSSVPVRRSNIAGMEIFAAIEMGEQWALSAQERDVETGEATFVVARRLGTGDEFRGAAIVVIDASVLRRFAESQDLGEGSTISIIRSDGWVIARNPPLPAPLDVSTSANFQYLQEVESGSYSSNSPVDNVSRLVGFKHVRDLGYIAIASMATDTVLAPLWRAIWIVSLLLAPIALALLVGSFIIAGLLRRTEAASHSLAAALEHNETLFREIHHRVKNNLQSISSLLQLHPIPRAVRTDMSQRIAAMSAVHEHIYRSHTFDNVEVREYLHKLIENIQAGYDSELNVEVQIDDLVVDKDAATPLGMIVNEVVSNAFKHAFKDGRTGTVSVTLVAESEGRALLTVRDNGVGFDPDAPAKGIGRRLIGGLTAQLQGESEHVSEGEGSVFTLRFPLAR